MTKIMLLLMLAASGADLASTEYAIRKGGVEANPLMRSRPARFAVGLGTPIATYLLTRHRPRAAKWIGIIHISLHGAAAARNIYFGITYRWGGDDP